MKKLLRVNYIKYERQNLGLTQSAMAEKSGLSLRTIQRVENSESPPKGHTLKMLAKAFNVDTFSIAEKYALTEKVESADKVSIRIINISVLGFFILPFGNIIFPLAVWIKRKKSPLIDKVGRKIINFQIVWSIIMSVSLCISAFIITTFPLILYVLFIAVAFNLFIIIRTAFYIHQEKYDFLNLAIRFL